MARAKKEAALTPEERLQAALIPDWEWPYKLPENWCWVQLSSVKQGLDGFFDGDWILSDNMDKNGDVRLLQLSDIGITEFLDKSNKHINHATFEKLGCTELEAGDVMISRMAEPVARSCIVPKLSYKVITAVDVAVLRCNKEVAYNRYINYLCNVKWFADRATALARGTTRIRITRQNLGEMPVPLAPLAEQQRIVDRIESLFAKLDEAKEKAQAVVDSFETRKAAILHKAFTGELTANWREEHGVGIESWEKHAVDDLCHSLKYGTAKKSDANGQVVVIRMGNLQQGEIDWSDLAYSNDDDDIEKYKLYPGDVLFNRTNSAALVGKTSIYRGEYPAIYAGYLIKLDYDHEQIIGDYLNYALNTLDAKEYCNSVKTDGVNQSNINAKKIGAYSFNVPSVPEQKEVVGTVQRLLLKEKQAKEAAEAVLDQIDLMKKSILARAFRGELGTNAPTDEPAVELLKRIFS